MLKHLNTFQSFNSNIERLIVAGNSVSEMTRNKESMNKARYLTKDEDAASVGAVNNLDEILVCNFLESSSISFKSGFNDVSADMSRLKSTTWENLLRQRDDRIVTIPKCRLITYVT